VVLSSERAAVCRPLSISRALDNLVNWLASPLGNLLWDLVLVVATVALIPLVLALLEKFEDSLLGSTLRCFD
jgi:hypothetical protein